MKSKLNLGLYRFLERENILKVLNNAPVLEHLTLVYAQSVDIIHLEQIHTSLPLLKHLELHRATTMYGPLETPLESLVVAPTTQMLSFNFHIETGDLSNTTKRDYQDTMQTAANTILRWLIYIDRKYKHIDQTKKKMYFETEYEFSGKVSSV